MYDKPSNQVALGKGTKITVVLTFAGEFFATSVKNKNYKLIEVSKHYLYSPAIDYDKPIKEKVKYKSSFEHPWYYSSMYFKEHSAVMQKLYTI